MKGKREWKYPPRRPPPPPFFWPPPRSPAMLIFGDWWFVIEGCGIYFLKKSDSVISTTLASY
jgi:hypothetical protein